MDFYASLGPLILGSRLRRASEYYIAEVNKVYQQEGITFDASWFPVFLLLSERSRISLRDIADTLQVSHSAVSQLVGNLKRQQLVETEVSEKDARSQLVKLSVQGNDVLLRITPIWDAISAAFAALVHEEASIAALFEGITAMERACAGRALADRITDRMAATRTTFTR